MKRPILVQKYGGTSVGSTERIKKVAERIIASKSRAESLVIVVSAMGHTTDELVSLSKDISKSPDPREYDALLSTGENISAALVAMALIEQGQPAVSLTGPQAGVRTENLHSRAKILGVDTTRLQKELALGKVVVVTGFQGFNEVNDVTTIGRGGSDTSAVVLAAAIGCDECEIFTDVDGVYTTDPRKVKSARKLETISYDEMLELASLGAGVLHPRSVECAKENNIVIHVRSSFSDVEGTRVKEIDSMEANKPVTGVTVNKDEAILSIINLPDTPGIAGKVFTRLAKKGINVDMIIQSVEHGDKNNISFSVNLDDLDQAKTVTDEIAKELGASKVTTDESIAKVSAVGVGMISKPGIAAKMFETLGNAGINILRITTSEIKISCAIPRDKAELALNVLHEAFALDKA